jgi:acetyl esterase/lipase
MSTDSKYTSILTLFLAPWLLYACGNSRSGGVDGAAAGRGGSGGSLATAGTVGNGGAISSGGQHTGGATASGGETPSSAGQADTGGATASGGSTATVSTTMTGGSSNARSETSGGGSNGGSTDSGGSHLDTGVDAAIAGSTGGGGGAGAAGSGSAGSGGSRFDGGVDAASGGSISSGGSRPDAGVDQSTGGSDARPSTSAGGKTGAAQTIKNINYAGTSSASQTLDLLLPANALFPLPLVVRIHGGGFSSGDKAGEETGTAANAILAKGYALASVNYRLSGQALFPAGVQDVKAAVRWLRAHATQYGLDTDRFASWGESAGGYMAVMLGVTGDQATVFDDDSLGNPGVSSAVAAVVDWYGPVDLATMDSQQTAHSPVSCPSSWLQHTPANSPEGTWLGGALNTPAVSAKLSQANLISYLATAKTLPFFIIAQGDNDCQVPYGQSQELADALAKLGNTANLTIIPGYSHGDSRFETTQSAPDLTLLATLFGR